MYNTTSHNSWPDRRLNPTQLNSLGPQECLKKLFEFIGKWKYYDQWRQAISYVLKNREQPQQFDMLRRLCDQMAKLSKPTLTSALQYSQDSMVNCRSLGSFYLLQSYYIDSNKYRYVYTIRDVYNKVVEKCGLYEDEVAMLEDLSQDEYPPRLLEHVRICVDNMPKFFAMIKELLNPNAVERLLGWVQIYPQKTRQQVVNLNNFCRFMVKSVCDEDGYTREFNKDVCLDVLINVVKKCDSGYPGSDNLYMILQHLPDYFMPDDPRELSSLTSNVYVSCFARLTKCTLTAKMVKMLSALTTILRRQSQFFTLKRLYKQVVLPRLVRFQKGTTSCQNQLRKLVKSYVQGFMGTIPITKQQLSYFFHNHVLVKKADMQFWLKLACIACYGNHELEEQLNRLTARISTNAANKIMTEKDYTHAMESAWEINEKDLKQRKKYMLRESKMAGINNSGAECYIISVMQMLFMTKSVPELLKTYEKDYTSKSYLSSNVKSKLLYQLKWLMSDLLEQRKSISISAIKLYGPAVFRQLEGQQDCHEYISGLFSAMEAEFAELPPPVNKDILRDFKRIFQIKIKTTIRCQKCGTTTQQDQQSFIHSINLKEDLAEQWITHVAHTCEKCKTTNPNRQMRKRITRWPEILLVHLVRYSFKDKQIKQLGSSNIPRRFKHMRLMGFISHIGSSPVCGHYVLYWRKEGKPLTWLEFNDKKVYEIQLEAEDEAFQRNFAAANTPYILIYQQIGRG